MKSVLMLNPGLLTTIQAAPRVGFRKFGVPGAGAMDQFAMRCANWLVGNNQYSPLLESTLLGPEIKFLAPVNFSITGAECNSSLDMRPVQSWKTIKADEGSVLKVSPVESGTRIYISFSGGLAIKETMGSASTYIPARIGGSTGRGLVGGELIPVGDTVNTMILPREIKQEYIPKYNNTGAIRILPGVDRARFTEYEIQRFMSTTYKVSLNSDRMGIRLEGEKLVEGGSGSDVISYGIHSGAIQISGDGRPIIMGVDAQTTGGYRQIANVISADMDILAQLSPSQEVSFEEVDYKMAVSLLRQRETLIDHILS